MGLRAVGAIHIHRNTSRNYQNEWYLWEREPIQCDLLSNSIQMLTLIVWAQVFSVLTSYRINSWSSGRTGVVTCAIELICVRSSSLTSCTPSLWNISTHTHTHGAKRQPHPHHMCQKGWPTRTWRHLTFTCWCRRCKYGQRISIVSTLCNIIYDVYILVEYRKVLLCHPLGDVIGNTHRAQRSLFGVHRTHGFYIPRTISSLPNRTQTDSSVMSRYKIHI